MHAPSVVVRSVTVAALKRFTFAEKSEGIETAINAERDTRPASSSRAFASGTMGGSVASVSVSVWAHLARRCGCLEYKFYPVGIQIESGFLERRFSFR